MKFSEEVHFVTNDLSELTSKEVFDVLKLRSQVFVSEQICVYLDPDDQDLNAIHMRALSVSNQLIGYSRIYCDHSWHIGRISTAINHRNLGIGKAIVSESISYCKSKNSSLAIEMSAQVYLTEYYSSLGFKPSGNMYLEDGIPHLKMRYQD